jgi:hypothetical protein
MTELKVGDWVIAQINPNKDDVSLTAGTHLFRVYEFSNSSIPNKTDNLAVTSLFNDAARDASGRVGWKKPTGIPGWVAMLQLFGWDGTIDQFQQVSLADAIELCKDGTIQVPFKIGDWVCLKSVEQATGWNDERTAADNVQITDYQFNAEGEFEYLAGSTAISPSKIEGKIKTAWGLPCRLGESILYEGKKAKVVGISDDLIITHDVQTIMIKSENFHKITKEDRMAETKTEKPSLGTMLKNDAEKAAYRLGARRISAAGKNAIVSLLKSHKFKKTHINAISEILDTEYGHGMVSLLLGVVLEKVPMLKNDKRIQLICEEFRIEGMAIAGERLLDDLTAQLLPSLKDILKSLPGEENKIKLRIGTTETKSIDDLPEAEEKEEKVEKKSKTMTASLS